MIEKGTHAEAKGFVRHRIRRAWVAAVDATRRVDPFDRFVAFVFVLSLAANAAVILGSSYWPGGDLGGHVELVDVMMRYDSPATLYRRMFVLPDHIGPNGLVLGLARLLAGVTTAMGLTRACLVFYVVGLPLSMVALLRAYGRSPWMAFLSVPMVFSSMYNHGFLNFLVGLPLLFFSIAAARTFAERGGVALGLALAVMLPILLLAHVIAFLIGLGVVFFLLVVHMPEWRRVGRFSVVLPSLVPLAPWVGRMFAPAEAGGRSFVSSNGLGLVYTPREELIANVHRFGLRIVKADVDEYLALALVVLLLAAIGFHRHEHRPLGPASSGPSAWLRHHSLECTTLVSLVMYFALPSHMNEMAIITERVIGIVMLLFVAWPRIRFDAWSTRALLIPFASIALGYAGAMAHLHRAFEERYLATLPQAIAELPDRSRLAYVFDDLPDNEIFHVGPLWHWPRAIHSVRNGGVNNDSFAARHYTPVQYRSGAVPPPLPSRTYPASDALAYYDAVLVWSHAPPNEATTSPRLSLRYHEGSWWLFDVVRPARSR